MKYILLCLFTIFFSCNTMQSKTYICGDRACLDKKEFNEYFSNNLVLEIKIKKNKNDSVIDLVNLNIKSSNLTDKKEKSLTISKKEQKNYIKMEKVKLKEKRKREKIDKKNQIIKQKNLAKLENKTNNKSNIIIKDVLQKKKSITDTAKAFTEPKKEINKKKDKIDIYKKIKTTKQLSICAELLDCDIDKITELLIKNGREKDFPDMTVK